jgi:hypothetical protein
MMGQWYIIQQEEERDREREREREGRRGKGMKDATGEKENSITYFLHHCPLASVIASFFSLSSPLFSSSKQLFCICRELVFFRGRIPLILEGTFDSEE